MKRIWTGLLLLLCLFSPVFPASAWTGSEAWRASVGASITTDVVYDDGLIYVGDELGNVHALNANSGVGVWSRAIDGTVVGRPVIVHNFVVAAGRNGVLSAFDKKSGQLAWEHTPSKQDGSVTFSDGAAAGDGKVFICVGNGRLYAVRASDGGYLWDVSANMALITAPVYSQGVVYFGDQEGIFSAVDANSGNKLWGGGAGGLINTPTPGHNGYVYFSCADGSVSGVNIKERATAWQTFVGSPVSTPPVTASGRIFVGTAMGSVVALSESNGGVLWNANIGGGNVNARPVVGGGAVFVGSGDGTLYALDPASGATRWSWKMGREILGAPCFENGVLYAASSFGEVIAFR